MYCVHPHQFGREFGAGAEESTNIQARHRPSGFEVQVKKDLRIFVQSDEFNSCKCSHGGREHMYAFHYSQEISKCLPIRWVHGEIAPSDTQPFWG